MAQRAGPTEAATGTGRILSLERRIPVLAYNQLHGSIVPRFGVSDQAQGPDCRTAPPKPSRWPPADEAAGPTPAARPSCGMVPDRADRIGDRHLLTRRVSKSATRQRRPVGPEPQAPRGCDE